MNPDSDSEAVSAAGAYARLLKTDFASFLAKIFAEVCPGTEYLHGWHIDLIAEYLEAAQRGEITRLIVNLPPRSLKSVCVSVAWPAWILGHDPSARVIAASYSGNLALKHSLDCRRAMGAAWYRGLFPRTELSRDQNEKHKFMTTRRGFRLATSVGGTLTGEGGNFLILDDPLNPEQAASASVRAHANAWFDSTFASRLDDKKKGVMVLVMQRLHAADMTAHLLEKGWKHLCLPAIAPEAVIHDFGRMCVLREEGEPLHAAREDLALLERAKKEMGSHAFAAQYQQSPVAEEGNIFKSAWLSRYDAAPYAPVRVVQSWDTAIKSGPENDLSCCLTFAEAGGDSYLIDAFAARLEYPDLKRAALARAERFRPNIILIEDKASGHQLLQELDASTPLPVKQVRVKDDKITRAAAASAFVEAGRLKLPREAEWLAEFEQELLSFPNAAHDDRVDALTQYILWARAGMFSEPRLRSF